MRHGRVLLDLRPDSRVSAPAVFWQEVWKQLLTLRGDGGHIYGFFPYAAVDKSVAALAEELKLRRMNHKGHALLELPEDGGTTLALLLSEDILYFSFTLYVLVPPKDDVFDKYLGRLFLYGPSRWLTRKWPYLAMRAHRDNHYPDSQIVLPIETRALPTHKSGRSDGD